MIVLKTTQAAFLAAMQRVIGMVERRQMLPILANVLMRKTGASIEFITTDLEAQISTRAELGGDAGDFAITVNARKVADILRAMPADQIVTLTAARNKLTLQGGRSRFTLQTLPADEFPLVREASDFGPDFTVPKAVLKSLIEQVDYAMAVQDIRYFLNGVLFSAEGRRFTLVATDGNRLAQAVADVETELPKHDVILPRKTVLELRRLLREADHGAGGSVQNGVQMRFGAAQAVFAFDGIAFVSKLVEGRFPDVERVIPKTHRHSVTLGRAPLLAGLQRVACLTSDRFKGVRLNIAPGMLRLASSNADHEEADEDIEVDYGAEPIEIGLNITYLLDVLGKASTDEVTMELHDAHSSVLFTFPGLAGFKYVVSPMRL